MYQHRTLTIKDTASFMDVLQRRFKKHPHRHQGIAWHAVEQKLKAHPAKLKALFAMEDTDGEPDVVGVDKETGDFLFFDCCAESPKSRRSLCYDEEALLARKEHKPKGSAKAMAQGMGIELLDEAQYRHLQQLGNFDLKTSSWLHTPETIRSLGGAIFGDRRFDTVFVYHNGAESYYAARGFRGCVQV